MFGTAKYLHSILEKLLARKQDVEFDLIAERTGRIAAERQVAQMQATLDWMAQHLNEMKTERAMLFQRALQVSFPVPEVHYTPPPAEDRPIPAGVPDDLSPDVLRKVAARVGAQVRIPVNGKPANTPLGLPDLENITFEDVGDAEAGKQGIAHDRDGEVTYDQ
jgi:hypothetical protein